MLDVTLRIMTPEDIEAGLRLTRAARWNQLRRDWEMFLDRSPERCFVAQRGEEVIGTAATIRYQDCFSWIGMVLVDPAERGQGIGKRLFGQAVEALRGDRCIRLDATPAGEHLYLKFDFRKESGIRRMEAETPSFDQVSSARPIVEDDLSVIAGLDLEAFGADRSFLLRWLWEGAREYAWAVEGRTGIEGYVFGRHGFNFEQLGPIMAPSAETARDLVFSGLRALSGRRVIIDAPDDPRWLSSLSAMGFREQRPFIRMYRGEEARPARPEAQWGFLGPEFG
jgi:predicted N-acetyltransferase YhbS